MVSTLAQDLRFSLRQFRRTPGFAIAAVAVLALGLGANTAIFSVVNALLLRPLPYAEPDRLAAVFESFQSSGAGVNSVSPGAYYDWRDHAASFESLGGYATGPFTIAGAPEGTGAQKVRGAVASRELFTVLGVSPILGRVYTAEEEPYGVERVALIGHALWQQRFGGDPSIVGKRVRMDNVTTRILGVMPPGFAFPYRDTEVWLPLGVMVRNEKRMEHSNHFLRVVGRLKPGATVAQARAEVDALSARYKREFGGDFVAPRANAIPLRDALVRDTRSGLLALFAAVCVVLLIACVNVANLLLARAAGRTREVSIRAAIGASRGRLVRQLLTESLMLSVAGAAVGLLVAQSLAGVLAAHAPDAEKILRAGEVPIDWRVFAFTFGAALLTGVAAGLAPAIHFSRFDLASSLREAGRSVTHGRGYGRFRTGLVVAEVALSMALLAAAGVLLHSFARLIDVRPGMRLDHTLTVTIPMVEKEQKDQYFHFYRNLPLRLAEIPGVRAAGLTTCTPLSGDCSDNGFYIEGRPAPKSPMDALARFVTPGFIDAAGITLLRGRDLTAHDPPGDENTAILISESMATTFFPGEDPIGLKIRFDSKPTPKTPRFEIVGVVSDVLSTLDKKPQPTFYAPMARGVYSEVHAVLHTEAAPQSLVSAVRAEVARVDSDVVVDHVRTMDDLVGESTADRRFQMLLFGAFASLAMVLAAAGLYGVLSYGVSRRRGEIGVRMALGASGSDVRGLILRDGLRPALIGIAAGIPAAAAACRLLKSFLFSVDPIDPLTFTAVPLVLLTVAALASYLPAARAARVDPTVTLRSE
jgi:putative ABC transport system permease protein